MRLLLDECVPKRLRRELSGYDVQTVREAGWAGLKNGALLRAADGSFDALITVDQGRPAFARYRFDPAFSSARAPRKMCVSA